MVACSRAESEQANFEPEQALAQNPASSSLDTPVPPATVSGRPRRNYRLPKRFRDILPEPLAPALPTVRTPPIASAPAAPVVPQQGAQIKLDPFQTAPNHFGLWRDYPHQPSADPDDFLDLNDLVNSQGSVSGSGGNSGPDCPLPLQGEPTPDKPAHWPFSNMSTHRFMGWLNNGTTSKSEADANSLVKDCILAPDFQPTDLTGFDAHRENKKMDHELVRSQIQSQFSESSVKILVPSGSHSTDPQEFCVPGLLHRKLTAVIEEAFKGPLARLLHYSPFRLFYQKTDAGHNHTDNERICGEIYSSDKFIEEYEDVQLHGKLPADDSHCSRERVVAALMLASDATRLANFGSAKAWPIYLMLGNLSKHIRSEASSGAMHHLAYIPSVSNL